MINKKELIDHKDFYSAVKSRRSYHFISNEPIISDEKIEEIVNLAVLHSPSAFNSQSDRAVILLGENHRKLWEITEGTLRKRVPAEKFSATEERLNALGKGYGTVLFFEDTAIIESLQQNFESYKDNFPLWSQQSSAMLQYIVWTALETEGYGVSIQHYNPLIDEAVKKEWNLPSNWKLIAQMPFGKPIAPPKEKHYEPIEDRVKVFK
ncbi:nitroreductase family protein [Lysinibacillus telephonicus]|uniref:nitroreductase family protein n=1 Tax=Lysinibacillus telephonicus TaxID=1714840 RepID=UPI003BA17EB2